MIAKVQGLLDGIEEDHALISLPSGITLELLLPAYASARLGGSIGQDVTLHTLMYLEAQAQGTTITPRLAGFLTPDDRAFYRLFVTCKGIGHRRALRAMTLSTAQIAAAIADRDLATLKSLPEVGKRTAETIAATLHDKVDRFIASPTTRTDDAGAPVSAVGGSLARETLEVLLQLGEQRAPAMALIDQALSQDDAPADVQAVVAEVYRLRSSAK